MDLRILMLGNDRGYLNVDATMLRNNGMRVYINEDSQSVKELVEEIKPDIIFINYKSPDLHSTRVYHKILDNILFASIPVVYTLSEDDVYLVNRKRTAIKERRYLTCDNVLDAIKMAVCSVSTNKRRVRLQNHDYQNIFFSYRV